MSVSQLRDDTLWHGKKICYSYKITSQPNLIRVAQSLGLEPTGTKPQVWESVKAEIDRIYQAQGWTDKWILHCIREGVPFELRQQQGQPSNAALQTPLVPPRPARIPAIPPRIDGQDPDYVPTRPSQIPAQVPRPRKEKRRVSPPEATGLIEASSSPRQQSKYPLQVHAASSAVNGRSGSQISQETANETSVEFLSQAERLSPALPPAQQTLDLNALRKLVLAAAHQPFHVGSPPRISYHGVPGRIAARNLASLFDGKRHPGISTLRIVGLNNHGSKDHRYHVGSSGELCAFRGRGPIWSNNSCAFDCVLVAARLLQVGLSPVDYGSGSREVWLASLSPNQRDFLNAAVDPRWDVLTREQSIAKRDRLLGQTIQDCNSAEGGTNQLKQGRFLAVAILWNQNMSPLNQFAFGMDRSRVCSSCGQIVSAPSFQSHASLTPDFRGSDRTLSMQELLQKHFGFLPQRGGGRRHCVEGSVLLSRRIVQATLPTRLVIYAPTEQRNVLRATSDMTFNYKSLATEEDLTVTYRWLGGIYRNGNHYRVYFTDAPYGDVDGYVQIYDGMAAEGAIIGEVLPKHPDNKVPSAWANQTDILFYEKVNLTNYEAVAQHVLYGNDGSHLEDDKDGIEKEGYGNGGNDVNESDIGDNDDVENKGVNNDAESDIDAEGESDYDDENGIYGSNYRSNTIVAQKTHLENYENRGRIVDTSSKKRRSSSNRSNASVRSPKRVKRVRIDTSNIISHKDDLYDASSDEAGHRTSSRETRTGKSGKIQASSKDSSSSSSGSSTKAKKDKTDKDSLFEGSSDEEHDVGSSNTLESGKLGNSRRSGSNRSSSSTGSPRKARKDDSDKDSLFDGSSASPASRSSKGSGKALGLKISVPSSKTPSPKAKAQKPRTRNKNDKGVKRPKPESSSSNAKSVSTSNFSSEHSASSGHSQSSSRRASLRSATSSSSSSNRSSDSRSSSVKLFERHKRHQAKRKAAAKKGPAPGQKHPPTGRKGIARKGPATGSKRPPTAKKGPAKTDLAGKSPATGNKRPPAARKGPARVAIAGKSPARTSPSPPRSQSETPPPRSTKRKRSSSSSATNKPEDIKPAKRRNVSSLDFEPESEEQDSDDPLSSPNTPSHGNKGKGKDKEVQKSPLKGKPAKGKRGGRPRSNASSTSGSGWSTASSPKEERKRVRKELSPWRNLEAEEPRNIGGQGHFGARRRVRRGRTTRF